MINVLVIGSGAYVSGKNSKGFGTILPSLIEGTRQKIIDRITIVSKHSSSYKKFQKKVNVVQKIGNTFLTIYSLFVERGIKNGEEFKLGLVGRIFNRILNIFLFRN